MLYVLCELHKSTYHLFSSGKNNKCEYKNAYFLLKCTHTHTAVLPKPPLAHQCLILSNVSLIQKNLLLSPPGNNTVVKGHIKRISDNDL